MPEHPLQCLDVRTGTDGNAPAAACRRSYGGIKPQAGFCIYARLAPGLLIQPEWGTKPEVVQQKRAKARFRNGSMQDRVS